MALEERLLAANAHSTERVIAETPETPRSERRMFVLLCRAGVLALVDLALAEEASDAVVCAGIYR